MCLTIYNHVQPRATIPKLGYRMVLSREPLLCPAASRADCTKSQSCSRTTTEPNRTPSLQCPSCESDFLEELTAQDDPRRNTDFPPGFLPGQASSGSPANPFTQMLAQILGASGGPFAPPNPNEAQADNDPDASDEDDNDAGHEGPQAGFTFTFATSGVDAQGRRFTRTHTTGAQPSAPRAEQSPDEPAQEPQHRPQTMNDFLTQAFSGNPNPNTPPSSTSPTGDRPEGQQQRQHIPGNLQGLLGAIFGGGHPATAGPEGARADGGLQDLRFIFNSAFGPMVVSGSEPAMQWGDALNDRGFDNFITALINQANANAEGPRPAPEETINELPRKKLQQSDIGQHLCILNVLELTYLEQTGIA